MHNRIVNALKGEQGSSNMEIIVWIAVVLVIAVALFILRDNISTFINNAANNIGNEGANPGNWGAHN